MEPIDISIPVYHRADVSLFANIFDQGIDSRLEAFVKSKIWREDDRVLVYIHPEEVSTFLRRLSEDETTSADVSEEWIDDILSVFFEIGED